MFYEITIKTTKTIVNKKGDGTEEKEVNETFIIDKELFGECELAGLELYNNNCDVVAIRRSAIKEIVNQKEEDKPFYKATISSIYVDESGKEKKSKHQLLVCAANVKDATEKMLQHMKQGMDDMILEGVVKSKIIDVL